MSYYTLTSVQRPPFESDKLQWPDSHDMNFLVSIMHLKIVKIPATFTGIYRKYIKSINRIEDTK